MQNERRSGNGTGGGGDSGEDDGDGVSGPNDATVVVTPDEFLYGAIGRLSGGLRGAADRCERFRKMVEQASSEPALQVIVLEELEAELAEVGMLAAGAQRGGARLRAFVMAKIGLPPAPKP